MRLHEVKSSFRQATEAPVISVKLQFKDKDSKVPKCGRQEYNCVKGVNPKTRQRAMYSAFQQKANTACPGSFKAVSAWLHRLREPFRSSTVFQRFAPFTEV